MIDLNGYTREAIQKAMLDRVPRTLDTREGSVIQTAPVSYTHLTLPTIA